MAFWGLPGLILRLRLGNAPKWPSVSFLGPFCGLGMEMLQNGFLEVPSYRGPAVTRPGLTVVALDLEKGVQGTTVVASGLQEGV